MAIKIGKNISADVAQKSGKSIIIASSEGNADIPGANGVKLGLNIYKKA